MLRLRLSRGSTGHVAVGFCTGQGALSLPKVGGSGAGGPSGGGGGGRLRWLFPGALCPPPPGPIAPEDFEGGLGAFWVAGVGGAVDDGSTRSAAAALPLRGCGVGGCGLSACGGAWLGTAERGRGHPRPRCCWTRGERCSLLYPQTHGMPTDEALSLTVPLDLTPVTYTSRRGGGGGGG